MSKTQMPISKKDLIYLPVEELLPYVIEALLTALGPIETARFLTLPRPPRMDSVLRHQAWQKALNKEQFFDQVFNAQE
ncbi:MAG: hypothetical protein WHX52_06450 [Anaerolineae bacterium]